jgi:hypothetical protein
MANVQRIDGFHNPEDVDVVASAGLAIVSNTSTDGGESLSAVPLDDPTSWRTTLWPRGASDDFDAATDVGDPSCLAELPAECRPALADAFSPHGISAVGLDGGIVRVAAVDHRQAGSGPAVCAAAFDGRDAIEMFDLRGQGSDRHLVWRGCARMPWGTRGNDLAVTGDGKPSSSPTVRRTSGGAGSQAFSGALATCVGGDIARPRTGPGTS